MPIIRIPSFHYAKNAGVHGELETWQRVSAHLHSEAVFTFCDTCKEDIVLGLLCWSFGENLV